MILNAGYNGVDITEFTAATKVARGMKIISSTKYAVDNESNTVPVIRIDSKQLAQAIDSCDGHRRTFLTQLVDAMFEGEGCNDLFYLGNIVLKKISQLTDQQYVKHLCQGTAGLIYDPENGSY